MENLFIPITKVNAERREVWGWGAIEEPDNADEILDYASSKPHFLEWSNKASKRSGGKSLGNVRAMHQNIAAGKIIELRPDDMSKGFYVGAKIIDDGEWKKVEQGVYTGFSVGGSYLKRWSDYEHPGKIRYTAKPTELSIVDAPCINSATFQMVKVDGSVVERRFQPGDGQNTLTLEKWEEQEHPRADDGKFTSGGGGGGGKKPKFTDKDINRRELPPNKPGELGGIRTRIPEEGLDRGKGDNAPLSPGRRGDKPTFASPEEIKRRGQEALRAEREQKALLGRKFRPENDFDASGRQEYQSESESIKEDPERNRPTAEQELYQKDPSEWARQDRARRDKNSYENRQMEAKANPPTPKDYKNADDFVYHNQIEPGDKIIDQNGEEKYFMGTHGSYLLVSDKKPSLADLEDPARHNLSGSIHFTDAKPLEGGKYDPDEDEDWDDEDNGDTERRNLESGRNETGWERHPSEYVPDEDEDEIVARQLEYQQNHLDMDEQEETKQINRIRQEYKDERYGIKDPGMPLIPSYRGQSGGAMEQRENDLKRKWRKIQIGDVMNKLENIYSLLDNIETALRKDIPGAPEPIADIPLNSDVGMDVVVEQMPAPSVPMEIKPNAEPSQEILAQHAVNSKDLTPAFNAWIPKIGEMVKKMVSDALTENGFGNTNPAPARMIKVVSGKKLIKVERSKKS